MSIACRFRFWKLRRVLKLLVRTFPEAVSYDELSGIYSLKWSREFDKMVFREGGHPAKAVSEAVSTNVYDKVEEYPDCTVQILRNSVTGEESAGWWKNG